MKRLVVLGSTSTAGCLALELATGSPNQLLVVGLADTVHHRLLLDQVEAHQPAYVAHSGTGALGGAMPLPLEQLATLPEVDVVVVASDGDQARAAVTAALQAGKRVVLADLGMAAGAGGSLERLARRNDTVLPADPALSAIWQCLQGEPSPVKRIILPLAPGDLSSVAGAGDIALRVRDAVALFNIAPEALELVEHPQNQVRAMVEFLDGSVKAVFGQPDARQSMLYALSYPERWKNALTPQIDLVRVGQFTFTPVDLSRYPVLAGLLNAAPAESLPQRS